MVENKKKKSNLIIRLIQIILVGIILYSLFQIGTYYFGRMKAGKEYDAYEDIVTQSMEEYMDIEVDEADLEENGDAGTEADDAKNEGQANSDKNDEKSKTPKKKKFSFFNLTSLESYRKYKDKYDKAAISSLKKLRELNPDVVAFINIPGLSVRYPVVYRDNNFYLRRNLKKEYSLAGTIFIEEKNKPDFSDKNTVLYGHNMSNAYIKTAEMFEPILKYFNKSFVSSRPYHYIDILTDKGVNRYMVFSAYFVKASSDYRSLNMGESEFNKYISTLKGRSSQNFHKLDKFDNPKIVTLSTCDNVNDDGRFTVHAIKVD